MNVVLRTGIVAISIDLELRVECHDLDQQGPLEVMTNELSRRLNAHRMPATWAVFDPAVSVLTDHITALNAGHEIAVLGDRTWVGRAAGRHRFSRELERRVTRGRAAGVSISTLLLRDTELDDHLDLVLKQGITAIAAGQPSRPAAASQVMPLRFGLWKMPTTYSLPGARRWFSLRGDSGQVRSAIDRAVAAREVCHLWIDGLRLAVQGPSGLKNLAKILHHVEQHQQQGRLQVATLAGTAALLAGQRHTTPARSILRPAA